MFDLAFFASALALAISCLSALIICVKAAFSGQLKAAVVSGKKIAAAIIAGANTAMTDFFASAFILPI
jgi:hypothetical protein